MIQLKREHPSTAKYHIGKAVMIAVVCLIILYGCASKNSNPVDTMTASDFYPIRPNTKYSYTGQGNEYASYTIFTDYTALNKVQFRTDNGGTTITEVVLVDSDQVVRTYFDGSKQGREPLIDSSIQNEEEILLMNPIKQGNTWSLPDGSTRTITAVDVSITTSLGTYQTIEVTTQNDQITKQYYAKDVGLVKVLYEMPEGTVSSELTGIDSQASYTQFITFYFADIDNDAYHAMTQEVSFKTNQRTYEILETAYRSLIAERFHTMLTVNTHIENITRYDENTMIVDLSPIYYQELSAGAGFETKLIQSFVNTIGQYYGVSSVIVTVGGEPYSSGHIYKEPNESFAVDLTNVIYE